MARFVIEPHFRLQEWVAEEKGYFRAEGLDYEFRELIRSTEGQHHNKVNEGAFQSIEKGRSADVSCACHWTVNVAASRGHAKLYSDLYSVAPAGIFVAPDSGIKNPADLAGVPISVGYQSGSHYSVIQALEQYMPARDINLTFEDGMLFRRLLLARAPQVRVGHRPSFERGPARHDDVVGDDVAVLEREGVERPGELLTAENQRDGKPSPAPRRERCCSRKRA